MTERASVTTRKVGKTVYDPTENRRVPGESKEVAVVRTAWCGTKHPAKTKNGIAHPHKTSSKFEGVNEAGWVFWCDDCGSRFIALPAEEA